MDPISRKVCSGLGQVTPIGLESDRAALEPFPHGQKRHPNKEIADAVAYAEARGWVIVRGGAHAWGILRCRHGQRAG